MKKWVLVAIVVIVLIIGFSYISLVAINTTSEPQFCMKCHTMKPMAESFALSMHGGNNQIGFKAAHCTDCHLPHNNLAEYLIAKGTTGTRDILAEIGLTGKADFSSNYFNYDRYVYDSGCLKCHEDIKNPSKAYGLDPDIRNIHEYYWGKKKEGTHISCTYCHNDYNTPNFAHPGLLDSLWFKKIVR